MYIRIHFDVLQVGACYAVWAQAVQRDVIQVDECVQLHREPSLVGYFLVQLLETDAGTFIALGSFRRYILHRIPVGVDVEQPFQSKEVGTTAWLIADHENTVGALIERVLDQEEVLLRAARGKRTEV